MGVSEAIKTLRAHLSFSQERLAREIGATLRTVARYEHGDIPKGKYLTALMSLAGERGREDLAEIFGQQKFREAQSVLKSLQSPRSARRISYWELSDNCDFLNVTLSAIEDLRASVQQSAGLAESVKSDILNKINLIESGVSPVFGWFLTWLGEEKSEHTETAKSEHA
jgi:transcriptional regulator with XRE-family HTH domain